MDTIGEGYRVDNQIEISQGEPQQASVMEVSIRDGAPVSWKRQLRSILSLPVVVTIVIPFILFRYFYQEGKLRPKQAAFAPVMTILGLASILFGLSLIVSSIRLFAVAGRGTLAPWDPTESLVIRGPYRFVRNPMISGVCLVLLGEAMILDRVANWLWFIIFTIGNLVYIPFSEEKGLQKRFGHSYQRYQDNVPRWIPRPTAWEGLSSGNYPRQ